MLMGRTKALREISQSLPRLEVYGKLYPTLAMQKCVAALFAKVIEFLKYAYLYYRLPGWSTYPYPRSH